MYFILTCIQLICVNLIEAKDKSCSEREKEKVRKGKNGFAKIVKNIAVKKSFMLNEVV